jgi:hypothetical protein
MFCVPVLVFGGTEGVGFRFHVLAARNHFRRYRRRWVPFSCFAHMDTFLVVRRALGLVFMFNALELVFCGFEGVGFRFHVLRSLTCFRRCEGCRVPFPSFALSDSFSAIPRASGPFSCFVLPDSFSAVLRASGPVFLFCVPVLVFGGSEGVRSYFHVLGSRTRFRR